MNNGASFPSAYDPGALVQRVADPRHDQTACVRVTEIVPAEVLKLCVAQRFIEPFPSMFLGKALVMAPTHFGMFSKAKRLGVKYYLQAMRASGSPLQPTSCKARNRAVLEWPERSWRRRIAGIALQGGPALWTRFDY